MWMHVGICMYNIAGEKNLKYISISFHGNDEVKPYCHAFILLLPGMGVESGGTGDASPAVEKSARDVPPEIMIFQYLFFLTHGNFAFFNIFKIKWPKFEEKQNFRDRWTWMPMNPSPQTKLRGDALATWHSNRTENCRIEH